MADYGCIICGADLKYLDNYKEMTCSVCGKTYDSNAECVNGHFVCDSCHQLDGVDFIENFCLNSKQTNPIEIAEQIMKHESIKAHGPEHHFLVPAVLLTAYYNSKEEFDEIPNVIATARKRSAKVPGGFCGFNGACGAGIGTGVFMSIILKSTPLSEKSYGLANKITAETLSKVAKAGGPRCCKRNSFFALETAVEFVEENLDVKIGSQEIDCRFYLNNKECLQTDCKFFSS